MKSGRIVHIILAALLVAYAGSSIVMHSRSVRDEAMECISGIAGHLIGTEVSIGDADFSRPFGIDLKDLVLLTPDSDTLMTSDVLSVRLKLLPLLRKQLEISGVRLIRPDIRISRDSIGAVPNYQFLLDRIAKNKDADDGNTDGSVSINSIIIRNGRISSDIADQPQDSLFRTSHVGLSRLNANISVKTLSADTARVIIRDLSFRERAGFMLRGFRASVEAGARQTDIWGADIRTADSRLQFDRASFGIGMDGSAGGAIPVRIISGPSHLNPSDFASFMPQLSSADTRIAVNVDIDGDTERLRISSLDFSSDEKGLLLTVSGGLNNVTDSISADRLTARYSGTAATYGWIRQTLAGFGIRIPETIGSSIGNTDISLTCDGDIGSHVIGCDVRTSAAGSLYALYSGQSGVRKLKVSSGSLNIGRITGNRSLGRVRMQADARCDTRDSLNVSGYADIRIPMLEYDGYSYDSIHISGNLLNGRYTASAKISDSHARLTASADYRPSANSLSVRLNADSIDLAATGLNAKDSVSIISGDMTAILTGSDIDNIRGRITVNDLQYTNPTGTRPFHTIELLIRDYMEEQTMASLSSEFINVSIAGRYKFSTLARSVNGIFKESLPSLYGGLMKGRKDISHSDNLFDIRLTVNDNDIPEQMLGIPLRFNDMLILNVHVDDASEKGGITLMAPSVSYGEYGITGTNLFLDRTGVDLSMTVSSDISSGTAQPTSLSGFIGGSDDRLSGLFTWKGPDEEQFSGNLIATATFGPYDSSSDGLKWQLDIDNSNLVFNGTDWRIDNTCMVASSGRYDIRNFLISHEDQFLSAEGTVSADSTDMVTLRMQKIDLADLMGMTGRNALDLSGITSGEIVARSVLARPILSGSIQADGLGLLGTHFGDVALDGRWNNDSRKVEISTDIESEEGEMTYIGGTYSPLSDSIDFGIDATNLDVYFLNHLLPESVFREVRGNVTTIQGLRLSGTVSSMDLEGAAILHDGYFDVAPNNCRYTIDGDTLRFEPGNMIFRGIHVNDEKGNQGIMNCYVGHTHMHDFTVSLDVASEGIKIYSVPKTETATIYGEMYVGGHPQLISTSGSTSITGPCISAPGTEIHLNIGRNSSSDYQFLTIRDAELAGNEEQKMEKPQATRIRKSSSGFSMSLDLEATDDAQIYIDMGSINGRTTGRGNMQLNYSSRSGMSIFGSYQASGGKCALSLQDLLRKEFTLLGSSRIVFNGDINSSSLDIHASHSVSSVSLLDLDASAGNSSRVNVNCLMDVTGTIGNPQLGFNVELPQGSPDENDLVRNAVSTEEQRNMQFMYLLALGKFYTYDYSGNGGEGSNNSTAAMESLLNSTVNGQINNLLAQVISSNNFTLSSNVSTGYLSENNDATFVDNTFEGILEARLLNNRLIMNGNFGYRQNALNNSSNFIGDFELKWLLFPKAGISILGYNRNNQRYFTKTTLNTQGIGVAYQTDF